MRRSASPYQIQIYLRDLWSQKSVFNQFFRFFRHLNLDVLLRVIEETNRQRLPGLAAEMAYSNTLAMFPALIAGLTVIGSFHISLDQVKTLVDQWLGFAPQEVVNLLAGFAREIELPRSGQIFSISFAIALWAASGAIRVAMAAMDQIHQTPNDQRRPFLESQFTSVLLTLVAISFVLVASFFIFISDLLVQFVLSRVDIPQLSFVELLNPIRWFLAMIILALGFSFLYRYGPSQRKPDTPIFPGAMIAALLWAVLSVGLRFYVRYFANYSITYGALSAGILLLLWLNLSSLTLLIGAQLNVTVGRAMRQNRWNIYSR